PDGARLIRRLVLALARIFTGHGDVFSPVVARVAGMHAKTGQRDCFRHALTEASAVFLLQMRAIINTITAHYITASGASGDGELSGTAMLRGRRRLPVRQLATVPVATPAGLGGLVAAHRLHPRLDRRQWG